MKLKKNDLLRFSKQIILKKIGIVGQQKLLSTKVLVIGAGGLGCPIILYLANSGIGSIGIADNDKVDFSNLNRQILYTTEDVGKFKASQAKKAVNRINKNIKINVFKNKIKKNNIKNILNNFDIICDGTDNFETKFLINDYCLKNKKILISAAINRFDGHVFNFDFRKNIPCLRCFMPEPPYDENNCETDGVLSTLAGIAGTLQANEVVKTILNVKNDMIGKVLVFNSLTTDFRKIKLSKNLNCTKECRRK